MFQKYFDVDFVKMSRNLLLGFSKTLTLSVKRGSKESKVMQRAKEIKSPDHLGQLLTFPPFYGSGEPKLTDMDKIRAIRSPKLEPIAERKKKHIENLKSHIETNNSSPISQFMSHRYMGWQEIVEDMKNHPGLCEQNLSTQEVTEKVVQEVKNPQRFFAVISFGGDKTQFKVTTDDVFVHQGECEAKCGDRIKIEKVLLAGGKDFTLVGMPILKRGLVNVEATLIEKTFSHMEFWQEFWRDPKVKTPYKGQVRYPYHVFRVNSISVNHELI